MRHGRFWILAGALALVAAGVVYAEGEGEAGMEGEPAAPAEDEMAAMMAGRAGGAPRAPGDAGRRLMAPDGTESKSMELVLTRR